MHHGLGPNAVESGGWVALARFGAERAGRSCPEPLSLPVDSHFIPGICADLTKCSSVCVAHQLAMKDERGEHAR